MWDCKFVHECWCQIQHQIPSILQGTIPQCAVLVIQNIWFYVFMGLWNYLCCTGTRPPPKFHLFPAFPRSGDFGTPRKLPQFIGDSTGHLGTSRSYPNRTRRNRGHFRNIPEVPRPIGDSWTSPNLHSLKKKLNKLSYRIQRLPFLLSWGFNVFMTVLRNLTYIVVILLILLLGKGFGPNTIYSVPLIDRCNRLYVWKNRLVILSSPS